MFYIQIREEIEYERNPQSINSADYNPCALCYFEILPIWFLRESNMTKPDEDKPKTMPLFWALLFCLFFQNMALVIITTDP